MVLTTAGVIFKTSSQVFVTGVKEITTEPALYDGVLEYKGRYYKVRGNRQEVKSTKTEDDTFYLLTLAAVVKELRRRRLMRSKGVRLTESIMILQKQKSKPFVRRCITQSESMDTTYLQHRLYL